MDAIQAEDVYKLVVQGFTELGAADPQGIRRSILLRDMHYAGQVFRCEGWQALWLIDRRSVEFRDAAGTRVRSVPLEGVTARRAA